MAAIRLALAYREEFGHDVVVDLVGYRRFGHNEQDEAAYTQPLQTERIAQQPPVRVSYAQKLVGGGVVEEAASEQMLEETLAEIRAAHDELRQSFAAPVPPAEAPTRTETGSAVITAVPAERLLELNEQLFARRAPVLQRWQGVYASAPQELLLDDPAPGVRVASVTTGIGMTTGLGFAAHAVAGLL